MNAYDAERYVATCEEEQKANRRFRAWQLRKAFADHQRQAIREVQDEIEFPVLIKGIKVH